MVYSPRPVVPYDIQKDMGAETDEEEAPVDVQNISFGEKNSMQYYRSTSRVPNCMTPRLFMPISTGENSEYVECLLEGAKLLPTGNADPLWPLRQSDNNLGIGEQDGCVRIVMAEDSLCVVHSRLEIPMIG